MVHKATAYRVNVGGGPRLVYFASDMKSGSYTHVE